VCKHQAFRIGTRAYGLQFHVEVDGPLACRWAEEDAAYVRSARGPNGPALVIEESKRLAEVARAAGDRLIRNILEAMTA
jgi:GMP synthase (glutamine-hydrolysing)